MRPIWLALFLVAAWTDGAAAQDFTLSAAFSAYERAEFEDALSIVDGLLAADPPAAERARALQLRATLLFALRQNGWRATLRELARLAPSHPVPSHLPPQLLSAWQLARASELAPNETVLARARAAYVVADFEGTLRGLRELPAALTPEQHVEKLVLEALARFGLRDLAGTQRVLRRLARVSPETSFGRQVPPSFHEAWDRARNGVRTFQES